MTPSDPRRWPTTATAPEPVAGRPGWREVRGIMLRYLLVALIAGAHRPVTVAELRRELDRRRIVTPGRLGKDISDALRWEVARGRIVRVGRATYAVGYLPRTTAWRMRKWVTEHRLGG